MEFFIVLGGIGLTQFFFGLGLYAVGDVLGFLLLDEEFVLLVLELMSIRLQICQKVISI